MTDAVGVLLDQLRPYLTEMASEILEQAIVQAPIPRFLPASVQSSDPATGTILVLPDGAVKDISARSLIGMPSVATRVMLMFLPPSGVFAIGFLSTYRTPRRVGGKWRRVAVQAVATGTPTLISWDTEDEDSDEFVTADAVTATAITVPTGCDGLFFLSGQVGFAAPVGGARSFVDLVASSYTNPYRESISGAGETNGAASGWFDLTAGDTFGMSVFQGTGGPINVNSGLLHAYRLIPG